MRFLLSLSWWLVEFAHFVVMLVNAIGVYGKGSASGLFMLAGMTGTSAMLALQWCFHGFLAAAVSAIVYYFVLTPQSAMVVLRYLGKRGLVHMNPRVAWDIAKADADREVHGDRIRKMGASALLANRPVDKYDRDMATAKEDSLRLLRFSINQGWVTLDHANVECLVDTIQLLLGPISQPVLCEIALNPFVVGAYKQYMGSRSMEDASALHRAIRLGHM